MLHTICNNGKVVVVSLHQGSYRRINGYIKYVKGLNNALSLKQHIIYLREKRN